jgi:hypothetical protein
MVLPTRERRTMNNTRAKNLIASVFSDLQVNPGILASLVYGSVKDDAMVRLHDFIIALVSLWAGPNNETEKTAHVYRWARRIDHYRED